MPLNAANRVKCPSLRLNKASRTFYLNTYIHTYIHTYMYTTSTSTKNPVTTISFRFRGYCVQVFLPRICCYDSGFVCAVRWRWKNSWQGILHFSFQGLDSASLCFRANLRCFFGRLCVLVFPCFFFEAIPGEWDKRKFDGVDTKFSSWLVLDVWFIQGQEQTTTGCIIFSWWTDLESAIAPGFLPSFCLNRPMSHADLVQIAFNFIRVAQYAFGLYILSCAGGSSRLRCTGMWL